MRDTSFLGVVATVCGAATTMIMLPLMIPAVWHHAPFGAVVGIAMGTTLITSALYKWLLL